MKNYEIPKEVLAKIGTTLTIDNKNYIITGITKKGKSWEVAGFVVKENEKYSNADIKEWREASLAVSQGRFGFIPGKHIGVFN